MEEFELQGQFRWADIDPITPGSITFCMRRSAVKLFIPPVEVAHIFQQMPADENFQWLD